MSQVLLQEQKVHLHLRLVLPRVSAMAVPYGRATHSQIVLCCGILNTRQNKISSMFLPSALAQGTGSQIVGQCFSLPSSREWRTDKLNRKLSTMDKSLEGSSKSVTRNMLKIFRQRIQVGYQLGTVVIGTQCCMCVFISSYVAFSQSDVLKSVH